MVTDIAQHARYLFQTLSKTARWSKLIEFGCVIFSFCTVPIACVKRADFAFLLDRSSSIGGPRKFWYEKDFVKNVLDNFKYKDVTKMTTNVAVITYAEKAEMRIRLGDHEDYDKFLDALDKNVTYRGGPLTRIDLALTMVRNEVFTGQGGDRPDVPNYVVLLTDGRQNSGDYYVDINLVPWYAKPLWDRNITIFAIGVARARRAQLIRLAGKTGKAIYRRKLRDLKYTVNEIIPSECLGKEFILALSFLRPLSCLFPLSQTKPWPSHLPYRWAGSWIDEGVGGGGRGRCGKWRSNCMEIRQMIVQLVLKEHWSQFNRISYFCKHFYNPLLFVLYRFSTN